MKKLVLNDILLVIILIFILIVSAIFIYKPSYTNEITICVNGKIYGTYSLNNTQTINIENSGVVVKIENNEAFIVCSPCPDKTCINSPALSVNSPDYASIVCLPQRVVVYKNSSSVKEVDVIAG